MTMYWDPLSAWPSARRWLWAVLAVLVCWTSGLDFLHSLNPPRDVVMDFFQEWASARNLFNGLPIYTSHNVTIERYLGTMVPGSLVVEVNAHPPPSVLMVMPLAALDYFDAVLVWNLISLAALGVSLWIVARQLELPVSWWSVFPAVTLILLCGPLQQQNAQGQLNLILLLLLTGTWAADRSGKPRLAGALLGAAAAIKLFPAFLLLYFVVRRQWRVVWSALVSLATISALTLAVLGFEAYRAYFVDVMPRVERFLSWWNNASLTGICRKLFGPATEKPWLVWKVEPLWNCPTLARVLALVLSAMTVAIVLWTIRNARTRADLDLAFSLAMTAMLLVSPITWDHYFLLLLVPLTIVWIRLPATGMARAVFTLIVVAFWLPPRLLSRVLLQGEGTGIATPAQALSVLSLQFYALLALFLLGIVVARRSNWPGSPAFAKRLT
jgi:hypothetical protein